MPSINGPSITSIGRAELTRASSVSSTMKSVIPLTKECSKRFSTGQVRHSSADLSSTLPTARSRYSVAISSKRSVESSRRFSTTSSTASRKSSGTLS